MLIPEDVGKLLEVYEDHRGLISEFVTDVLALVDAQDLTELWVESYSQPEPRVGITPLKNERVGTMIWVPPIPEFDQLLAFLRHKDINLFRVPGESVARIDGIRFLEADFVVLRTLKSLLEVS
jgi:hypothetical protein